MRRHTYSTDNDYRVKVTAGLGILAWVTGVWAAELIEGLIHAIATVMGAAAAVSRIVSVLWSPFAVLGLQPEPWVPTTGVLFGAYFAVFNYWLWKQPFLKATPLVSVPDLSGEWKVVVTQTESNGPNSAEQRPSNEDSSSLEEVDSAATSGEDQIGTATISQTWRKLQIPIDFPDSTSASLGASFITDAVPMRFHYFYRNEPKPTAPAKAQMHYGMTDLRYDAEEDQFEGAYFTDRFRQTSGRIVLRRADS